MLLTQEVREGMCSIERHLDPERQGDALLGTPRARLLHGLPGAEPVAEDTALRWNMADLLGVEVPLRGGETLLATAEVPRSQARALNPVCLPFSPEFAPDDPRRGGGNARTAGGHDGRQAARGHERNVGRVQRRPRRPRRRGSAAGRGRHIQRGVVRRRVSEPSFRACASARHSWTFRAKNALLQAGRNGCASARPEGQFPIPRQFRDSLER